MESILNAVRSLLDVLGRLLSGEPARLIGYGAAVIVYIVARVSKTLPDVSLDQALIQVAAVIALAASVVETIRHYVYSPATVRAILDQIDTGTGPGSG